MSKLKLENVLPLLENVRPSGSGYSAKCPAHLDKKNSLSISETADGHLLANCFAGCDFKNILAALDTYATANQSNSRHIEAIYNYTDENGKILYRNFRFLDKNFRWCRIDKSGNKVWNLDGVRRVPYKLPELVNLPAHYDFVMTEGEKDADRLKDINLIATNHKNWKTEFNYILKNKNVVIFQDHDKTGVSLAEKAAKMIYRDAAKIKIVDCYANDPLPVRHGKDVTDFLETHSKEELLQLIRDTPNWTPHLNEDTSYKQDEQDFKVICLRDVIAEEIIWLWKPFIAIGEFTIIEGIEGLGKSWIACALACAVADGIKLPFSDIEPLEAGNVLMLSAEDSLSHTIKPRLDSMRVNLNKVFALDDVFSLDNPKDLIKFESVVAEYEPKLVIIDPLFSYTGGKNLNQESESRPLARKLIAIAQKFQCAVVGVRHIGKAKGNGDARAAGMGSVAWGSSARSVLLVGSDQETNEKAICQIKTNLAKIAKISVGFEIENDSFYWKSEPSLLTKERMLAQPQDSEKKSEQSEAVAFLREALSAGEPESKLIQKEARQLGITDYAFRKAKSFLQIESFKKGGHFGGKNIWYMRLPDIENNTAKNELVEISDVQHIQSNNSNNSSYDSDLIEDTENRNYQPLQSIHSTNSYTLVPKIRMPQRCRCGMNGFVGEKCGNCSIVLIPF